MSELSWFDAIHRVLEEADSPMSRTDIAETIVAKGLREEVGKTPANTVVSIISTSMKGADSPFVRVGRGEYWLKKSVQDSVGSESAEPAGLSLDNEAGVVKAFGMFWERSKVNWSKATPALFGIEQTGATAIDFSTQVGVYILYDGHRPIYVGRSTSERIGKRLKEHHSISRFKGRWDRFSWFGLCGVSEDGQIILSDNINDNAQLVAALEGVLIEALEPVQNRRRGDGFVAIEYLQGDDPEMSRGREKLELIKSLLEH